MQHSAQAHDGLTARNMAFQSKARLSGRSSTSSRFVFVLSVVVLGWTLSSGLSFVGTGMQRQRTPARVAVASVKVDHGKVNLGLEIDDDEVTAVSRALASPPPLPVLESDESYMQAINACLESECSVEDLDQLDNKLVEDEQKIAKAVSRIEAMQKSKPDAANDGALAWLGNFLKRSSSLRAQIHSLRGHKNVNFIKQLLKAASVSFGGGRHGDYPKVGVSSYSVSPP